MIAAAIGGRFVRREGFATIVDPACLDMYLCKDGSTVPTNVAGGADASGLKVFYTGDSLDVTPLTATAVRANGSSESIWNGRIIYRSYDPSTPGTQTVTASFLGASTTFQVTVEPLVTSGIPALTIWSLTVRPPFISVSFSAARSPLERRPRPRPRSDPRTP